MLCEQFWATQPAWALKLALQSKSLKNGCNLWARQEPAMYLNMDKSPSSIF